MQTWGIVMWRAKLMILVLCAWCRRGIRWYTTRISEEKKWNNFEILIDDDQEMKIEPRDEDQRWTR